jgi:two-component system response regulator DesR
MIRSVMAAKLRVAIVEDHPLVMQAIRQQFREQPDISVELEISHGSRMLAALRRQPVDLVLMDLGMDVGVFDPVSTIRQIKDVFPRLRILVISSLAYGETVMGVLRSDVHGYLTKNDLVTIDLVDVVQRVMSGERVFSPAIAELQVVLFETGPEEDLLNQIERDMLSLAAQGHTNRQIGFLLGYSDKTVRNRFTSIFRKLGASNRVDAIRRAKTIGLLAEG